MNISNGHFKELVKKGISLDLIWLLEKAEEGLDLQDFKEGKISNLISTLERRRLLNNGAITFEGSELLANLKTTSDEICLKKLEKKEDEFALWWAAYPGTTEFKYKGRMFTGSRALRIKKDECKVKITNILNNGFTIKELIDALNYEVVQKKEASLKSGENKLNYMQNSLTYLNQRTFEPYVELIREGKQSQTTLNSIDI